MFFLGDSKESREIYKHANGGRWDYYNLGMRFVSTGNNTVILARKIKNKEINELIRLAQEISPKFAVKLFLDNTQNIDLSLDSIKEYCLTSNREDILENCIDNIFKYISPKYIFVPRENDKRVIAVMCNYKFDMEHGIAVIFENEQFSKIGKQDIIL